MFRHPAFFFFCNYIYITSTDSRQHLAVQFLNRWHKKAANTCNIDYSSSIVIISSRNIFFYEHDQWCLACTVRVGYTLHFCFSKLCIYCMFVCIMSFIWWNCLFNSFICCLYFVFLWYIFIFWLYIFVLLLYMIVFWLNKATFLLYNACIFAV